MKKILLKTFTFLVLAILMSSCEKDNSHLETNTEASLDLEQNTLVKATTTKSSTKAKTNSCYLWGIASYEGPVWFDFSGEAKRYPYVNTIIHTTETSCDGQWDATGGFEIIESTKRKATIKRINQNAGTIQFTNSTGMRHFLEFDTFVPNGSSVPCPTDSDTRMYKSDTRYMNAGGVYVPEYTYSWTVVNNGRTIYHNNKTTFRMPLGRSTVTLSVSLNGCTTQTNTQSYFISSGNSGGGGTRPPLNKD